MFFAVILTRGNHVVDKSKVEYPTSSSCFRFGILPSDLMGHIPNWMSYIYYEISCALTFEVNLTQWSPGYLTSTPSFSSFLPAMSRGICNLKILLSFYWTDFCPSQTKFNLKWNRTAVGTVVYRNCSKVESNLEGKHVSPLSLKSFLIFLGWCHQYGSSIIVFISPCLFVFLRMFCRSI